MTIVRRVLMVVSLLAVMGTMRTSLANAAPLLHRRTFALSVLKRYSPQGFYIVHTYEHTPWSYRLGDHSIQFGKANFMDFVPGHTRLSVITALGTAVHESTHNFSRKLSWLLLSKSKRPWISSLAVPIRIGEICLVRLTPWFPSAEIAPLIPNAVRDLRFSTYVSPSNPDQSTQQIGIYGLLDEFNAYYHGTHTAVDLYGYFAHRAATSPADWLAWIQSVEPVISARGQFKIFILASLIWARQHHPARYAGFLANHEAVQAFLKTDAGWVRLLSRYKKLKARLVAHLRREGQKVSEGARFFTIGTCGVGTARQSVTACRKVLDSPRFVRMEGRLEKAAETH